MSPREYLSNHIIRSFKIYKMSSTKASTPQRQIRAFHDSETITVYQAYSVPIATAAVTAQSLSASPLFRTTRMTWIKPSWAWMLYRAGYSYKDPGQARILALKMKHADFIYLLEQGVLSSHKATNQKDAEARKKNEEVRIQWDPERNVRLDKLDYRSIQIGIPGALSERWAKEMIVEIEDVTERAKELKRVLDERPDVMDEELSEMGLVPEEKLYQRVPANVKEKLRMD
ncbi:hypothetical protein QBC38DRAFT_479824 [Podospora fimiseda]|uniref:ATP-dependent RNA helicase DHX8 n=1 Tax=Podospora fimiseda TaxID=252190 RepID=A0AAN7BNP8_9PEZI|nr:hypothetical protein QBC38DRAFT_479824 [Podospora fimiseda]